MLSVCLIHWYHSTSVIDITLFISKINITLSVSIIDIKLSVSIINITFAIINIPLFQIVPSQCLPQSLPSHCLSVCLNHQNHTVNITLSVSFIDITLSPLSTSQRVSQSSPSQSVSTIWRLYLEHLNNIILSADIDIILYLFELQNSGVYLRVTTYLCPPYSRSSWSSRRTGPNKQNWFVLLETMTVLLECISSTYRRISWRCI